MVDVGSSWSWYDAVVKVAGRCRCRRVDGGRRGCEDGERVKGNEQGRRDKGCQYGKVLDQRVPGSTRMM